MTRVSFGVAFQSNKTPAEYVALARAVDRYPFEVVSVYNDLLYQPALGPLLWMAPHLHRTQRIGPAALNPYLTHPIELAGQAALLDLATGGHAYLGLARGAWLDHIGVQQSHPVQTLREAVLLVKHLLSGNQDAFDGRIFRHPENAPLRYPRPRKTIPIMVGTWGEQTARMAGELADEIKVGGSANPRMIPPLKAAITDGMRRADRPADAVGICLGAVTVIDTDRQLARQIAQREVQRYLEVVTTLDPTTDEGEDPLERFALAGTPDDIVHQLEDIFRAGASRVEFGTPLGSDPFAALQLLGERVLPAFQVT
ncbi:MAG: LLM class flavin-dependent oxidoreductase [Chloroflexi bacterium]|nr:LLM class flavin-dependent oxidoreductase [Chloroflexota bacterium]